MACLANLKQDIKFLESVFQKDHKVFQILSASVDELTCRFISRDGRKYDVHANIMVSSNKQAAIGNNFSFMFTFYKWTILRKIFWAHFVTTLSRWNQLRRKSISSFIFSLVQSHKWSCNRIHFKMSKQKDSIQCVYNDTFSVNHKISSSRSTRYSFKFI